MSSLRLALKQSLQDATPPLLNSTAESNAATTTSSTSSSSTTTNNVNVNNNSGGGGNTTGTAATANSGGTIVTSTTHHPVNPNHDTKKSSHRSRNDDNNDHQSTSSEENEASLNDLDDMDETDDDDDDDDETEDENDDMKTSVVMHHHHHHSNTTKKKKVEPQQHPSHGHRSNHHHDHKNNHHHHAAAANRIQTQYRKTKKMKHTTSSSSKAAAASNTTIGSTGTSMSTHQQQQHPHHPSSNPSRTKSRAVLNNTKKKKSKKEKHLKTKSVNTTTTYLHRMSGNNSDHHINNDHDHDDDISTASSAASSSSSSSSWTVMAPSESVIRHMASLSNEICINNMVPGLRVKVLFDKPIRKWYGGYIEQIYDITPVTIKTNKDSDAMIPSTITTSTTTNTTKSSLHPPAKSLLRRIKIAYDDGTFEMTHFPDRKPHSTTSVLEDAIVIDANQNGTHMTSAALEMAQQVYTPSLPPPPTTTAAAKSSSSSSSLSVLPASLPKEVTVEPHRQIETPEVTITKPTSPKPRLNDDDRISNTTDIRKNDESRTTSTTITIKERMDQEECNDTLPQKISQQPSIQEVDDDDIKKDDSDRHTNTSTTTNEYLETKTHPLQPTSKPSPSVHTEPHPHEPVSTTTMDISVSSIPSEAPVSSLLIPKQQQQQQERPLNPLPEPSSSSSSSQPQPQPQQLPISYLEETIGCAEMDQVSTIQAVDANIATITEVVTSKGSPELTITNLPSSNTTNDNQTTDDSNNADIRIPHFNDSVAEISLVTITAPVDELPQPQQREDVVMEDNNNINNNSELILCDPPKDNSIPVETVPINDDVANNQVQHEQEATTDNKIEIDENVVLQPTASPMDIDDSIDETTNVSLMEVNMPVAQKDPSEKSTIVTSDIQISEPVGDTKILPSQQLPTTSNDNDAATAAVGTELSSSRNDSNVSASIVLESTSDPNPVSTDVVSSEVASTVNEVSVEKDTDKVVVNDVVNDVVQLGLNGDSNINNDSEPTSSITTTTTIANGTNVTMIPQAIITPQNNDDTHANSNVEASKVPPTDTVVKATQLISSTEDPPIMTNNVLGVASNTENGINENDNDERTAKAAIDNVGILDTLNVTKDSVADIKAVASTISEGDLTREDEHEKDVHLASVAPTISSNRNDNTDISVDGILNATSDNNVTSDPMSIVDEEASESKTLDGQEECLTSAESAISQPTISENASSAVHQTDGKEKHSNDVLPPHIAATKSTEGEEASKRDDRHSESMSSMNKLKRASPHTLPPQDDEPPKKKLTIRIPVPKMKQKPSNSDVVTTPKNIHINISGRKEVTETKIHSSQPSQLPLESSNSNGDMVDTSALSPRQLKKLALKQERKRQKMLDQKNSGEVAPTQMIAKDITDPMLIDKSKGRALSNADPNATPASETNEEDDDGIHMEGQVNERQTDNQMDSALSSTTTSEENVAKKKKKGVRRKAIEGDSDTKTSKETETELNDSQWVQCDECGKWRIIPTRVVEKLPKQWYCRDNIYDPKHSSCDAPEQTDKEVAREKKRRLKKKQRLLKTTEEAAAAAASQSHEPVTNTDDTATATANAVERSPRPPRDAVMDIEKPPKQQKRMSSTEESVLPEMPLTTTESRPPKKEKKLASTVKKGRSVESMDKLVPSSEDVVGVVAVTDVVKPRGRGRPRRANNATGTSSNTSTTKESTPIGGNSSSIPTPTAADDGENLEWVQCEKCDKWRKLPPHVSADDLPDVWTCTMNTWNPASASCDAPEDKSDGLQDIGVFGTNGSAAGKLTYRHLIFGSNGRKANRPISEKTCAAESIFSAHFDEDAAPTKVLYADSSAYISRGRPNISVDDNEGMSVLELMSHSKLWQELHGISSSPLQQTGHPPPNTSLFNNESLRMNAYTYDTLPTDIQGPMKEYVIRALDTDTLSGDEVVQRIQAKQLTNSIGSAMYETILPYCTATVIVTTLCDLVKIGTVECIPKIGHSALTDGWNPHYRRKIVRVTPINDQQQQHQQKHQELPEQHTILMSSSSSNTDLKEQRRRLSFPMKLSKPWKHAKMQE